MTLEEIIDNATESLTCEGDTSTPEDIISALEDLALEHNSCLEFELMNYLTTH